ncbi:MAG: S9 family peptidase [Armatimonadetes bacterium]|nr:S9 family peptidase [Armatimonadota bacterium]
MPKRPVKAEDLLRVQFVGDPQIHPEGNLILFSKKHITEKNAYLTHLFTVDRAGTVKQWTQGEKSAAGGRWSPDGKQILFSSGREGEKGQLYLLSVDGGEAQALTKLEEGSIGEYIWSPDGKHIAFTFRPAMPTETKEAKEDRKAKGLSEPPVELDSIWYRLDGDGYFAGQRHALWIVNTETGKAELIYNADAMGFYSFDWMPNSDELVVCHSANKMAMVGKPDDKLFLVSKKGRAKAIPGLPIGSKGNPKVSPDGKWVAYLGSRAEDDPWGTSNTHLFVVPLEGGEPRCLTEAYDYDMSVSVLTDTKDAGGGGTISWSPDGKSIYVTIGWHGEIQLAKVDVSSGKLEFLTEGRHWLAVSDLSADGKIMAAAYGNATTLPEIAFVDIKPKKAECSVVTSFNSAYHDKITTQEPEEVWLESTDGVKVQAWVIKPVGFKSKAKYPAVLEIHGGPHAQYGWAYFHEFQVLAAEGYVVVYSNPRGSKGYGQDYCAAIKGAWGDKDWDDVQTVTRYMQHHPNIHPGQMGVMGGSYGGYMTNWVVGHTKDFKAAITDRCVSNLVSMSGNSDFAVNKDEYFGGCAWGDLDRIAELWKQSPIAYFESVTTPMLIIHSVGDLRCNIEQSEQVFTALQMQGIESRFVRYPVTTSHGMSRIGPPDLRLHRLGEITSWWKKHLQP